MSVERFFVSERTLATRTGRRSLAGGNNTARKAILNRDYIDNVRCVNLFTNTITYVNSNNAVAFNAGSLNSSNINQGYFAISVGANAGQSNQSTNAIAIGSESGQFSQGSNAIAIGFEAGQFRQKQNAIAIGSKAGNSFQQDVAIAIGYRAGEILQKPSSVVIGREAGSNNFAVSGVAIGANSGKNTADDYAVSIGALSGANNHNTACVAVGYEASFSNAGDNCVAIGRRANFQGNASSFASNVCIGTKSQEYFAADNTIAVGYEAGNLQQKSFASSIGYQAGYNFQGQNSVAVGVQAGYYNQDNSSVAIGFQAGMTAQGSNCIAIGYRAGDISQHPNTVIINATTTALSSQAPNSIYINPIRQISDAARVGMLNYNSSTYEILNYNNAIKTFVIDHPIDKEKYLVHACLEGPEAGVYYRGKGEIAEDTSETIIYLPEYVKSFACDFTIHVAPLFEYDDFNEKSSQMKQFCQVSNMLEHSDVINGKYFVVSGVPCRFSWIVFAKRNEINVEPYKKDVVLKGDGPYTYIEHK